MVLMNHVLSLISGECRFSDFLLWQASSSVTYFAQVKDVAGVYKVPFSLIFFHNPFLFKSLFSSPRILSPSPLPLDVLPISLNIVEKIILPVPCFLLPFFDILTHSNDISFPSSQFHILETSVADPVSDRALGPDLWKIFKIPLNEFFR